MTPKTAFVYYLERIDSDQYKALDFYDLRRIKKRYDDLITVLTK